MTCPSIKYFHFELIGDIIGVVLRIKTVNPHSSPSQHELDLLSGIYSTSELWTRKNSP